jgi:hypothetical protein
MSDIIDIYISDLCREVERKVIGDAVQWLISQQNNEDEGFSPYPEYALPSGTIATADVVALLLRYPDVFAKLAAVSGLGEKLRESIDKAVGFLVSIQRPDGGFPPRGDVFNIDRVSFTDSTADVVLALLCYTRFLSHTSTQNAKSEEIKLSFLRGIRYLLDNRIVEEFGVVWTSYKNSTEKEYRTFPAILVLNCLQLFRDLSEKLGISEDSKVVDEVNDTVGRGTKLIHSLIMSQGFILSHIPNGNKISFASSVCAIDFLLALRKSDRFPYKFSKSEINSAIETALCKLLTFAKGISDSLMDDDEIRIDIPSYPPQYTATYRRDVNLLNLLIKILCEREVDEIHLQKVHERAQPLLHELAQLKVPWIVEKKGIKFTPAVSATVLFIAATGLLMVKRGG